MGINYSGSVWDVSFISYGMFRIILDYSRTIFVKIKYSNAGEQNVMDDDGCKIDNTRQ